VSRAAALLVGHRRLAAGVVLAALLGIAPTIVSPLLIGSAVGAVERGDRSALGLIALALAGLGIVGAVALAARTLCSQRLALALETELRERYFDHLLDAEPGFVAGHAVGDLVSRATVDLRMFRTVLGSAVPASVQASATIIAAAIVMLAMDPLLALVALSPLPLMALLGARFTRSLRQVDYESRRSLGVVASQAEEDVAGIAVIKGFAQQRDRLARFQTAVREARATTMRSARLQARFGSAISVLPGVGMVLVLLYGGLLGARAHGGISDAEFVSFYVYVVLLVSPAQQVGWMLGTAQTATAALRRVLEILDRPVPAAGTIKPVADPEAGIRVRGLYASHDGDPALRNVDFDVPGGATVAVAGAAGSGKTTLLEVIAELRPADAGSIRVGGRVGAPARIGLLADPDFLFAASIRDTIAYGRPEAGLDEVRRAATLAAASEFIDALPDGFDTLVGERAATLSGGQRQRLALARALLTDPDVLLLDNPTGSLDRATERAVLVGLETDVHTRATLMVSHRPVPLAQADEIVVLDHGVVLARGARDEVLAAEPGYRGLLGHAQRPGTLLAMAPAGGAAHDQVRDPDDASGLGGARIRGRARLERLRSLAAGERRRIAFAALATVLGMSLTLAPPYLGGRAVNDVVVPNDTGALLAICAALTGVLVVGTLATAAEIVLLVASGQALLSRLRERVMEHLLALPMRFFDHASHGAVVSRVTNDIEALDALLTGGLSVLISSTLTIAIACGLLLALNVELAVTTCAALPLALAATFVFSRRLSAAFGSVTEALGRLTAYMTESLAGINVIRTFGQADRHRSGFRRRSQEVTGCLDATVRLQAAYVAFIEAITGLALAGVILLGGRLAIDGTITIGVLVAFATYLRTVMGPIPSLVGLYSIYAQGMAGLDHVFELLDEPVLEEPANARSLTDVRGSLTVKGVSFTYDDEHWVLRDISLSVDAGETVAVVGLTGAGKSTLVKLLLRFYDPQRGAVSIDGSDLRTIPRAALRQSVGYVAQDPFLFSGTVWENIAFAMPSPSRDAAVAAAAQVGALDALSQLPLGLDTPVGARGSALSAGQRQLVALARATLGDRRIVILDEPTSSVDAATEQTIHEALRRLRAERTTLVIAHRLSTVREADRIIVIDDGHVAETGTHEDLLALGGIYARLYGLESEA
jgi:ATP-binding cassette, subfamily B, bacterial